MPRGSHVRRLGARLPCLGAQACTGTREPREHAQRALPAPRTGATRASPGTPPATWLRPRAGVSSGCPAAQTFLAATPRWPEQNVPSPSAHTQTTDPAYFFGSQLLRPLQVTVPTGSPAQTGGRARPSLAPSSSAVRASAGPCAAQALLPGRGPAHPRLQEPGHAGPEPAGPLDGGGAA